MSEKRYEAFNKDPMIHLNSLQIDKLGNRCLKGYQGAKCHMVTLVKREVHVPRGT